jgi:hypothetical protein
MIFKYLDSLFWLVQRRFRISTKAVCQTLSSSYILTLYWQMLSFNVFWILVDHSKNGRDSFLTDGFLVL